ncbi:MAG: hypothetical protein KZQ80_06915 [Candidatus Thiodiazotropha sp. (ex Monitilora ramsayi)]|nr:hypothetical protein [Candidatus Thiodiazotropha sp. (ex Monitilora ramsayi)]
MARTAYHLQHSLILHTGTAASPLSDDPQLEPAFLSSNSKRQPIHTAGWCIRLKAHYAQEIARKPEVLQSHVARIELCVKTKDSHVLGALLDLFLVLKEKGFALRRRMLALSKSLLNPHDLNLFVNYLRQGDVNVLLQSLQADNSILSSGITGNTLLIEKMALVSADETDPLTTAQQQLEYGQVELAQETLETALLVTPGCEALHHALLEIYRHLRQLAPVTAMWQRLQGLENPARAEWQALLTHLKEGQNQA